MLPITKNTLFYGDNLDILRDAKRFDAECVDLIYLDPPFNSSRSYKVLFKDESGRASPKRRSRRSRTRGIGRPRPNRPTTTW